MYFAPGQTAGEKPSGEVQEWWEHIKQNPLLYAAAVIFVALAALAGLLYRLDAEAQRVTATTSYARAMETEDPGVRTAELEQVAGEAPRALQAEVLYMAGESALEAGETERAVSFFEQVTADHPDSEFAAFSLEALGALAEDEGDYETALERYREVRERWPETLPGRRQAVNIGRVHEELDAPEQARDAYEEQLIVFAGSSAARRAQEALQRLQQRHPDLFAEPFVPDEELDPMTAQPPMPGAPEAMPVQPDAPPIEPGAEPGAVPVAPGAEIDPMAPAHDDEAPPEIPEVPEIDIEGVEVLPEPDDGDEPAQEEDEAGGNNSGA